MVRFLGDDAENAPQGTPGAVCMALMHLQGRLAFETDGSVTDLFFASTNPLNHWAENLRRAWISGFVDATADAVRGRVRISASVFSALSSIRME